MELFEIDWRSPLDAFAPLAREPFAALLHAGDGALDPGWSIAAAFPSARLTVRGGRAEFDGAATVLSPMAALRAVIASRRMPPRPQFSSGLIGFAGYETGALLEPGAAGPASPYALPDMAFGAYDAAALFDRRRRRAFVAARSARARDRLAEALGPEGANNEDAATAGARLVRAQDQAATHQARVATAIERIRAGDFFQVNLAQTLEIEAPQAIDPYTVFCALSRGDAPFGSYLHYHEGAIVSASPERFFNVEPSACGARIRAEPIKGTRPRGKTPEADMALARELVASAKDRAENVMIVDLLRNDLARVCRDGTIREDAICALKSFSSVHHLVSTISGTLSEEKNAVDAFEALFPCGSITGAPKIEAMRAISALEDRGRGPYCGAVGYIDDGGGADFAVAIRTLIIEGRRAFAPVGGGVTLRSDPSTEYAETLDKAAVMLKAVGVAS